MMRFIILIFLLSYGICKAQQKDVVLIRDHSIHDAHFNKRHPAFINKQGSLGHKINPLRYTMGGLLFLYQKGISPMLASRCPHYPSCSEFSKQCIERYGWVKGICLSADRLMRCNKWAIDELDEPVPRQDDLHNDLPGDYKKK